MSNNTALGLENVEKVKCEFSDRELLLLINGTHQRASTLLNISINISQVGYRSETGKEPTSDDIRELNEGSDEYFNLVSKLREIRNQTGLLPK